ncbi:MAG: copper resistance protein CopC [Acidimicrobiia bacterium]|jgi:copper transport protein
MARAIPSRSAIRRWRTAVVAVAALAAALLVGPLASVAGAHADVVSVSPTAGEVLQQSPKSVKVTFTEGVNVELGGLFVYDRNGDRVRTGALRQPSPGRLVLPIEGELDDGSYIVTWRAVSEDTHPIQGTSTFQVGNASASTADVESLADDLLAGQRADRAVAMGWAAARWTVLASMALLVGGVAVAAVIWPRARDARATRRVVTAGWVGLTASTVVGALLFGAYSRGGSLVDALDLGVLRDTLATRFGEVWLLRLVVLVVAFVLLRVLFARRPAASSPLPQWWLPAAAVVGVVLVCTPGLAGHASTGDHRVFALLTDGLHVGAMAVWLGGLVVLAAVVLPRDDLDDLRVAVPRFSRVALGCVGILIVTGAFQTWRLVGGLTALRDDEYGRILVVKLVVFALLLVAASFSREIVARVFGAAPQPTPAAVTVPVTVPSVHGGAVGLDDRAGAPDDALARAVDERAAELRRLRRSVWGEVALGALVLFVSALLVNAAPPADAASRVEGATGVTIDDARVTLDVSATPGAAGLNDLHVNTYTPAGTPLDVLTVEMTLALPSKGIAPLAVPLRELGPGHYLSPGLDIPLAGTWRVQATIRLGPVDRVDVTGDLEVRR